MNTTRRRRISLGLAVALVMLGLLGASLCARRGCTREDAAKIHAGMTRAEVEGILGSSTLNDNGLPIPGLGPDAAVWESDEVLICVRFEHGIVRDCRFVNNETFIEALRRWLQF
jgi:hypothetical protein